MAKKRVHPNRSYLRLARLYRDGPDQWTDADRAFVLEMEQLIDRSCKVLPEMCRAGRVDALLLQFERCRFESEKLQATGLRQAGMVVCPEWLAMALADHIREREDGTQDDDLQQLLEDLRTRRLELEIPLTRGVVLSQESALELLGYLVERWFEGTPGLRGRHSTADDRLTDLFTHYHRYSVVEDLRDAGHPLMKARLEAPETAEGSGFGSCHAFEKSHKLIVNKFKDDPDAPVVTMLLASVMLGNQRAGLWPTSNIVP